MKVLVVLVAVCLARSQAAYAGHYSGPLASPVVSSQGFLQDTPEVAAAKAAHFSEVAKVSSPAGYAPGPYNGAPAYNSAPAYNPAPSQWNNAPAYSPAAPAYNPAWNVPAAPASPYVGNPSVTPQGFLQDTPDVAAAKAAHLAELSRVHSGPQGAEAYDDGSYRPEYDNPSPAPVAPAHHAYSAPSHAYNAPSHSYSPAPVAPTHYNAPSHYSAQAPAHHGAHYAGPLATPVVTPQGFLQDTPEVAAAKAAHFTEVARAGSHQAPAQHGRYRRSAVLLPAPVTYSAHYPAVYPTHLAYATHYPAHSWGYSVRTW